MSEELPRQIGRYEAITLLGEGGMARAYLVVNRGPGGFNKLAVIKQILPQYASDENFVAMFLDEARLAARLHHPNIVQTFDVAEHDGTYLLAMEYLDGLALSTIYRRIHPKVMPLETHLWVLTQILTGLHYAHTLCDYDGSPLGVVHRDVNPANILVTYSGEVKLLDFGVAKAAGALAAPTERSIKGKPAYCAPEQLYGGEPDARADVFSAGVMLWEVLAGRRFNRGATMVEAAKTRLSRKEPLIREVCPDVDPDLADICDRAMAWDSANRYSTAAEFRIELQAQLDKRNASGRQFLLERMNEVFTADRRELHKLIETRLADRSGRVENSLMRPLPTPSAGTPSSAFTSPRLSPAPIEPTTIPIQPPVATPSRSSLGTRLLIGMGVLSVAVFSALIVNSLRGRPAQANLEEKAAPTVTPPPAPTPAVAPPPAPAPTPPPAPTAGPQQPSQPKSPVDTNPVGFANPSARSPLPGPHALAPKFRQTKPQKVSAVQPRGQNPSARSGETFSNAQAASDGPSPAETHAAAKRRTQPLEQPASAVQPGAHLTRPAGSVHTTVDEKDPYTP
jgi:serine/threonine-protein kinase